MIKAMLLRERSMDWGTFGRLTVCKRDGEEFMCFDTLELPWRDNLRQISCIPEGSYRCSFGPTGKGRLYRVENVPGRDGILFHAGNWAGDHGMKMRCNSFGCILIGDGRGDVIDQPGIFNTREALDRFHKFCGGMPVMLEIQWKRYMDMEK